MTKLTASQVIEAGWTKSRGTYGKRVFSGPEGLDGFTGTVVDCREGVVGVVRKNDVLVAKGTFGTVLGAKIWADQMILWFANEN